jgi:hypothetical protein
MPNRSSSSRDLSERWRFLLEAIAVTIAIEVALHPFIVKERSADNISLLCLFRLGRTTPSQHRFSVRHLLIGMMSDLRRGAELLANAWPFGLSNLHGVRLVDRPCQGLLLD